LSAEGSPDGILYIVAKGGFPDGLSIMEQFKLITQAMVKYIMGPPARITGAVNMIRPDGTQPAPQGFTGPAESIPWGLNVDGNEPVKCRAGSSC
jgi:hypothetical protein